MKNIPKKIYLNFGFDADEVDENEDFNKMTDVSWSDTKMNTADIEYVLSERQTSDKVSDNADSKALSIADVSKRFSIDAVAPIEDALYATNSFTTEQCSKLADGIIQYLKDAGFACIKVDIP